MNCTNAAQSPEPGNGLHGARDGNRTRTTAINESADFKSAVSTYFTTRASRLLSAIVKQKSLPSAGGFNHQFYGGAARSRTGLAGFAIRYITALLPRRILSALIALHCMKPNTADPSQVIQIAITPMKKDSILKCCPFNFGAGEESRTLDLNLGKVALYQLSYSRIRRALYTKKGSGQNLMQNSF